VPEVREVRPGHLVRCGHSSAYDVNFGKEAGAAAVILLEAGLSGVTVVGVKGTKIFYIDTQEAIKQRHVDMDIVSFHETMGVCFGRRPVEVHPEFHTVEGEVDRYM